MSVALAVLLIGLLMAGVSAAIVSLPPP